MSSHHTENQALNELRSMAELYRRRGVLDKADKLEHLADQMEWRLMKEVRDEQFQDDLREEA